MSKRCLLEAVLCCLFAIKQPATRRVLRNLQGRSLSEFYCYLIARDEFLIDLAMVGREGRISRLAVIIS